MPAFIIAGAGMGLFFAPIANVVLSAVRPEEEGKASGANNAIRELGGVFGVAVLAAVFTANGSYVSPDEFVDGLIPAMQVGAVVVGLGALAALALPGRRGTDRGRGRRRSHRRRAWVDRGAARLGLTPQRRGDETATQSHTPNLGLVRRPGVRAVRGPSVRGEFASS